MPGRRSVLILIGLLAPLALPFSAPGDELTGKAIQEYLVVGTVVWTNAATASIAIRGTTLLGRLHFEVKSFHVKQPASIAGLHPGDRIMAVFSENDGMLHRLRRSAPRNHN